jgi:hypothetical protein
VNPFTEVTGPDAPTGPIGPCILGIKAARRIFESSIISCLLTVSSIFAALLLIARSVSTAGVPVGPDTPARVPSAY